MNAILTLLLSVAFTPANDDPPAAPPQHFCKPHLLGWSFGSEPRWPLVADLDADGFGDLVAVDPTSGVVDVAWSWRAMRLIAPINARSDLGAGLLAATSRKGANGRDEIVITRADHSRRVVAYGEDKAFHESEDPDDHADLDASVPPLAGVNAARSASTVLDASNTTAPTLVADFDGDGALDELRGTTLKLGKDPMHPFEIAQLAALQKGAIVVAGDLNGDKRADIVAFRRDDAWRCGRDILQLLSYKDGDLDPDGDGLDNATEAGLKSDPLDADTDHDGLPDGMEVRGDVALDFPALGASPTHKDCFVYVQRYSDTDGQGCAREVARVVKTWSELPNVNPDGTTGLALHPIFLPPLPPGTPGRAWWDLGNENLPKAVRGLAHYMELNNGGGGQAAELGDMGGCGTAALWACFLHEFGHQVGLSHSGGPLPEMCPTYTSLMSYAYSYGFEDDGNKIHYSKGELANLVLNETNLSERVAMPQEKIAFLAKGPYGFKLKADGDATLVDWNRDGEFQSEPVRADITDVYGAGCSSLFGGLGKTVFSPVIIDHRGQLLVFSTTREKVTQCHWCRWVHGQSKIEAPITLGSIAATGDPAAVSDGSQIVFAAPTAAGIAVIRAATIAELASASPEVLQNSIGLGVGAVLYHGRSCLLLWKDNDSPIQLVECIPGGGFAAARELPGLRSMVTPGAAEEPATGDLFVATVPLTKDEKGEHHPWTVTSLRAAADGGFAVATNRIVGGPTCGWCGNSRPILVFETGPNAIAEGRLHLLGKGFTTPQDANCCFYEAITIGDKSSNEGWRLRRFINEWTTTKSAVGACIHDGELTITYRWCGGDGDDDVHVMLGCYGISTTDMHDFDDVAAIADLGLERSIPWRDASVR